MLIRYFTAVVLIVFSGLANAAEPSLFIKTPGKEIVFTRSQLLARPDVTVMTTTADPTMNGKSITYTVVPAAAIFKGISIPDDAAIHFQALDNFSAPIEKATLMNSAGDGATAYIAIEKPDEKWPVIQMGHEQYSAAPFYLVWKDTTKSRISTELWVMQLAGFSIDRPFSELYPNVVPKKNISNADAVMRGFKIFKVNCFSCHTINREGSGKIGPDLNVPYNPTEYMHEKYLRIFIRSPKSLRHWDKERMVGFPSAVIRDDELNDLISYLKYMSGRKV
ncbi:MAG TPA: cytochrome c [Gammaproteobacteria bacterium]|jgi:cytochrome c2|nr:cytochrome c [Gammaproteobacteria bacterium]